MSVTDELIRNAERYAADFHSGELPLPPGNQRQEEEAAKQLADA